MKLKTIALTALLVCAIMACNKPAKEQKSVAQAMELQQLSQSEKKYNPGGGDDKYVADTVGIVTQTGEPEKKKQPGSSQSVPNPDWDKKIIKTASLNLEVKDYSVFYSSFREKVRALGGYVAQEEQSQSDYKIENTLVIKVPVDQFDNAVSQLTAGSEKINERKISSQDVTTEFIDTKSRIEAKKQVRLRYMDLLKQAKNMEEILSVQSEVNGIQEEIEAATGRIEYLGHSSAYSTINLTYYQVLNSSARDENKTPSFGTKISDSFKIGWNWVGDLFVGLVTIWPLFLLSFTLFIIYKRIKNSKPKQA